MTKTLGRYELVTTVDESAVATTWIAHVGGHPTPVRVVVLEPRVAANADHVAKFRSEARAFTRGRHPKLLRVVDVGTGPEAWFATDYVDAAALDEMLSAARQQGVGLSTASIAQLGLDVLDVLAESPRALHGDIGPHSILVTPDGVAHLAPTALGSIVASLGPDAPVHQLSYKAPEQLRGSPVDARADQFALGVVLWGAFAGHRLFVGADGREILHHITSLPIPKLAESHPNVPEPIARVIDRALARDPDERFPDAASMREALDAAAHSDLAATFDRVVGDRVRQRHARILDLFGVPIRGASSGGRAAAEAATPREVDRVEARFETPLEAPAPAPGPPRPRPPLPSRKPPTPVEVVKTPDAAPAPARVSAAPPLPAATIPLTRRSNPDIEAPPLSRLRFVENQRVEEVIDDDDIVASFIPVAPLLGSVAPPGEDPRPSVDDESHPPLSVLEPAHEHSPDSTPDDLADDDILELGEGGSAPATSRSAEVESSRDPASPSPPAVRGNGDPRPDSSRALPASTDVPDDDDLHGHIAGEGPGTSVLLVVGFIALGLIGALVAWAGSGPLP